MLRKILLVASILVTSACNMKSNTCNPSKKPVQVVAASITGGYRSWQDWTVMTKQGSNTYIICRGSTQRDVQIEVGKFYSLPSFTRDTDVGDSYDPASNTSSN